MEATFEALGGILLKSIPTLIVVLLLHLYLKAVFFRPLEKVLERRGEATAGARRAAEDAVARAASQAAGYEAALGEARTEIYREQEEIRRRWLEDQSRRVEESRAAARALTAQAKLDLDTELAAARGELPALVESLARDVARRVLEGKAA